MIAVFTPEVEAPLGATPWCRSSLAAHIERAYDDSLQSTTHTHTPCISLSVSPSVMDNFVSINKKGHSVCDGFHGDLARPLHPGLPRCSRGGLHSPPGPDNKPGEEQGRRCLLHGEQSLVLRCGDYFFGLFSGPGAPQDQMPTVLHPEGVYIGRYNSGEHSATCRHRALDELPAVINRTETSRPEAACMVAGDFNIANMRKVLPTNTSAVLRVTRTHSTWFTLPTAMCVRGAMKSIIMYL